MPWGAAIAAGGAILGGVISSSGAKSAATTEANAATTAAQLQAQQKQPWVDAGKTGLSQLSAGLAPGGQFTKPFTSDMAQNSDAEQFALSQGMGAINNSNAAKSGTLNTNALTQQTQFAEANAAQFQNQAFNQYQTEQNEQLGATESLAQTGLSAATSSADSSANLNVGAANAQAAGTIGSTNAITGGLTQLGNIATSSPALYGLGGSSSGGIAGISTAAPTSNYTGDPYAGGDELDSSFALSDERLKTDKKQVGKTKGGTPIYTYRMKGSAKRQMGVMAQDVEKKQPSAVRKHSSGFKMVDYSKVH